MTNALLLYDTRQWDAATVTASTAASGSPASNVLKDRIGQRWRSTSKTGNTLTFDLTSASYQTNTLGFFGHNLTSGATVYHLANTANSWGAPAYSQQLTVATDADGRVLPRLVYKLSPGQTYRYHRLTIDDPANTSNYVQIGRVMAGGYYIFTRNFALRARITYKDPTPIGHLPGSLENIEDLGELARFREFRVDFPRRTATEKRKLRSIFGLRGNSRPMVLALDIDNYPTEMSAYVYLTSDMEEVWRTYEMADFLTMVFEEKTR